MDYADSSFIVTAYLPEFHSPVALEWLRHTTAPLPFTAFHDLEVRNGIRQRQFRGEITAPDAVTALATLDTDLANAVWAVPPVPWVQVLRTAQRLSAAHAATLGCRSLDVLHVAAALTLATKTFLTFDTRQRAVAQAEGLRVKP